MSMLYSHTMPIRDNHFQGVNGVRFSLAIRKYNSFPQTHLIFYLPFFMQLHWLHSLSYSFFCIVLLFYRFRHSLLTLWLALLPSLHYLISFFLIIESFVFHWYWQKRFFFLFYLLFFQRFFFHFEIFFLHFNFLPFFFLLTFVFFSFSFGAFHFLSLFKCFSLSFSSL